MHRNITNIVFEVKSQFFPPKKRSKSPKIMILLLTPPGLSQARHDHLSKLNSWSLGGMAQWSSRLGLEMAVKGSNSVGAKFRACMGSKENLPS
jgi:hypothetical protein